MPDRKFRIVVADDEEQVRRLFTKMLEAAGYAVTAVDSGVAAFRILQTEPVDLLVLDLSMPPPDGFELLKQLHTHKPGLKILVISGMLQGNLLKAAEIVGATATLSKVDAPSGLVPLVRSILS
jgi:CheY-like chemotaxis protein